MRGAAFETHIYGEIVRSLRHRAEEATVHFYRTRDGVEIDFIVETRAGTFPIEVKASTPKQSDLPSPEKHGDATWETGRVVSLQRLQAPSLPLNKHWEAIGPDQLGFLLPS